MPPYNGRYNYHNYHHKVPQRPFVFPQNRNDEDDIISTIKNIVEQATKEQTTVTEEVFATNTDALGDDNIIDAWNAVMGGNAEEITKSATEQPIFEIITDGSMAEITQKSIVNEHMTPWPHVPHILVAGEEPWHEAKSEMNPYIILIIVLSILIVVAATVIGVYLYCKRRQYPVTKAEEDHGKKDSKKQRSSQFKEPQQVLHGSDIKGIPGNNDNNQPGPSKAKGMKL